MLRFGVLNGPLRSRSAKASRYNCIIAFEAGEWRGLKPSNCTRPALEAGRTPSIERRQKRSMSCGCQLKVLKREQFPAHLNRPSPSYRHLLSINPAAGTLNASEIRAVPLPISQTQALLWWVDCGRGPFFPCQACSPARAVLVNSKTFD